MKSITILLLDAIQHNHAHLPVSGIVPLSSDTTDIITELMQYGVNYDSITVLLHKKYYEIIING